MPNHDQATTTTAAISAAPSLSELIAVGTISAAAAEFLEAAVRAGCSILVTGLTASGKTVLLGALSRPAYIAPDVTVIGEETLEPPLAPLREASPNISAMLMGSVPEDPSSPVVSRDSIVRAAQDLSATRVILGDIFGGEALLLLEMAASSQAASFMCCLHSINAMEAIRKLHRIAQFADQPRGSAATKQLVEQAAPIVVTVRRVEDVHRVVEIAEVAAPVLDDPFAEEAVTPLWFRRDRQLVHSGYHTRHSARIRAHGWLNGERYWLAPEPAPDPQTQQTATVTFSHGGAGDLVECADCRQPRMDHAGRQITADAVVCTMVDGTVIKRNARP